MQEACNLVQFLHFPVLLCESLSLLPETPHLWNSKICAHHQFRNVFNLILKLDLLDRAKKFIDPLYQVWEDMSAEELQEFKKPIKKVNL